MIRLLLTKKRHGVLAFIILYIVAVFILSSTLNVGQTVDNVFELIASFCSSCWLILAARKHKGRERIFWGIIAGSSCCYTTGEATWNVYLLFLKRVPPSFSIADLCFMLEFLLVFISVFVFVYKQKLAYRGFRFLFDCIAVVLVGVSVVWYFLIAPQVHDFSDWHALLSTTFTALYPILDITYLLLMLLAYYGFKTAFSPYVMYALVGCLSAYTIADYSYYYFAFLYHNLNYHPWISASYQLGSLMMGYAGVLSVNTGKLNEVVGPYKEPVLFRLVFPYACLSIVFTLDLLGNAPLNVLTVLSFFLLILVLVRQILVVVKNNKLLEQVKFSLAESEFIAQHDHLTHLPNRRAYELKLKETIDDVKQEAKQLGVLLLDLDRFKHINDTYGHDVGDTLLQQVAKRFEKVATGEVYISRQGGDEFAILISQMTCRQELGQVGQALLQCLSQPFQIDGIHVRTSASIGIAVFPEDGRDALEMMRSADAAMYQAKRRGGSQYQFYIESIHQELVGRLALENELRSALEEGRFILNYQPQFSLHHDQIIGVEALVRCVTSEGETIPPAEFIPVAEETGLIIPLGDWILRTACNTVHGWHTQGLQDLMLSVNVSILQFQQEDFIHRVACALVDSQFDPNKLVLEITESVALWDLAEASKKMKELKRLGIKIAMDDFGTGYSSLAYLSELEVDTLKIDRQFISDMESLQSHENIVKAIITMAHSLNQTVVAEGVETREQLEWLRLNECEFVQGYLISKPLDRMVFEQSYGVQVS